MELNKNFKEFIGLLNENGVKYLVVDGFAVAYHGHPKHTKDMDFWVWADPENANRLYKTIHDFGMGSLGLTLSDLTNLDNVIQIGYEPNRIDLMINLEGVDFEICFAQRTEASFEGLPINFIGYEDLIKNKRATGRAKDRLDAQTLEKKVKKRKK